MALFCRHCGQSLPDDSKFCHACGASVASKGVPLVPTGAGFLAWASVALALIVVLIVSSLNFWPIGRAIGPTCTIGVTGIVTTVTVRGWTAPGFCGTYLATFNGVFGGQGAALLAQNAGGPPNAPTICVYIIAHDFVTVRDGGSVQILGHIACAELAGQGRPA